MTLSMRLFVSAFLITGLLMAATVVGSTPDRRGEVPAFPESVPPMVGTAVLATEPENRLADYEIVLRLPRVQWEVVGKIVPKRAWPRLDVAVEKAEVRLAMGGPSQLAP